LREVKTKANPRIVAAFSDILKRARAGQITGFAMTVSLKGKEYSTRYVLDDEGDVFGMLGVLEYLKRRIILTDVEGYSQEDETGDGL